MPEVAGPQRLRQLLDAVLTVGSDLDLPAMLHRIVEAAVDLVDAQYGALGVLDESRTQLAQFIALGIDEEGRRAIGDLPSGHGILGVLIVDAEPIRLADLRTHPERHGFPPNHPDMRSFLGVPIRVRGQVFGNLYLTEKRSGEAFTAEDEELVVGLASAAGVAIENARLQARLHELALVEDRERIARDLHDTVIQRLFATGLSLQGTVPLVTTDAVAAARRIEHAVDDLDLTVKHIRTAIFGLELSRPDTEGLRSHVLQMVREIAQNLDFEPRVLLDGPLDTSVDEATAADLLATLREAISNVVKHADAGRLNVEVLVDRDICLRVTDDGVGLPDGPSPSGHGLRNMGSRAERLGGSLSVTAAEPTGTVVEWRIPLTAP